MAISTLGIVVFAGSVYLLWYCAPHRGITKRVMLIPGADIAMPLVILLGLLAGIVITATGLGLMG